jgi:hypothetical protein
MPALRPLKRHVRDLARSIDHEKRAGRAAFYVLIDALNDLDRRICALERAEKVRRKRLGKRPFYFR